MHVILVVEDDESIRNLLVTWCRFLGHEVEAVDNGAAAVVWLRHVVPDFIITDLSMPGMNGFDLIDTIRHDVRLSRTKVIVLTGLSGAAIADVNDFAVSAILQKPIKFQQLRIALHGLDGTGGTET
jgi:CheY-like chemotaxis protein